MLSNSSPKPVAPPAAAPRVLLVEDELLVRMIIADTLRDSGYAVIEAFNGDEAISILAAGAPIDLVITDVRMPGSADGLDVLHFVRRTRPELPVVVTSGHLEPRLAQVGGAVRFLPKPCNLNLIVDTVHAP